MADQQQPNPFGATSETTQSFGPTVVDPEQTAARLQDRLSYSLRNAASEADATVAQATRALNDAREAARTQVQQKQVAFNDWDAQKRIEIDRLAAQFQAEQADYQRQLTQAGTQLGIAGRRATQVAGAQVSAQNPWAGMRPLPEQAFTVPRFGG